MLNSKKLFRIEFENGDRRRPKCFADDSVLKDLWLPWKHAIIVKLLGKTLGFLAMRDRLKALWKLTGDMDVLDIGHGFFMIKFDLEAVREKVISGGPWMIYDHCVAIRPWTTDFIASEVKINKTLVWIRFPSLGMENYDESLLLALASAVGSPVKVDIHTLDASRGKFSRVCIEINLDEPVVGKVWFRDFWYRVEYEGLHLLCKSCGVYGHVARNCTQKIVKDHTAASGDVVNGSSGSTPTTLAGETSPSANHSNLESCDMGEIKGDDLYGDWLVVNRKKNQGRKSRLKNQEIFVSSHKGKSTTPHEKGFQFARLNDVEVFNAEGNKKQEWGPQFHPGGVMESPKVWLKKNKRARGIVTSNKGVINTPTPEQRSKPTSKNPNHNPFNPPWMGQVASLTKPDPLVAQNNIKTKGALTFLSSSKSRNTNTQQIEPHPKPPDPVGNSNQIPDGGESIEGEDEMVVEVQAARH